MVSAADNFFFIDSINKVNINDWNSCVGLDHPFTRFEFLSALENSQSVNSKSGWKPCHCIEKNEIHIAETIFLKPIIMKNYYTL